MVEPSEHGTLAARSLTLGELEQTRRAWGLNQLGELKLKSSKELGALDKSVPVRSPLCQRIHLPNRAVYGILGSWREGKIVPEKGSPSTTGVCLPPTYSDMKSVGISESKGRRSGED